MSAQASIVKIAADTFSIESAGLDPITVVLVDVGPRSGYVIVRCWDQAWTCAWMGMGDRTVRQFVASVDDDYLAGKLAQGKGTKNQRVYLQRVASVVIAAMKDGVQ
jgi:hypothetical protein